MLQALANGVIEGLSIAVFAVSFAVVYLPTRVLYIALACVYTLPPYVLWECSRHSWPHFISVAAAVLSAVVLSILCELLNHGPLDRLQASSGAHFISSLGIFILVGQSISLIWGDDAMVLRQDLDRIWHLGSTTITSSQFVTGVTSVLALSAFWSWLHYGRLGLELRALADNTKELSLRGCNVRQLRIVAFGVSGVLCAISSLTSANEVGFEPRRGMSSLLIGMMAAIIGGRSSFAGAVLGGVLLGVVRAGVVWFLSAQWQEPVSFALLAICLLIRPQGLVGDKQRVEVDS